MTKDLFIIKSRNPENSRIEYMVFNDDDSFYRYWSPDIIDSTLFNHERLEYLQKNKSYDGFDFQSMICGREISTTKVYLSIIGEEYL